MTSGYLWIKAFHIIFVASWFAALFYLPRIFVNLAMVPEDSASERLRLVLMAEKLFRFGSGLMLIALALGLWLWLGFGLWRLGEATWLTAKLGLVAAAVAFHFACLRHLKHFRAGRNRRSHRWFRVFNEGAVLVFAVTVVLVVVKPF
ncbi:MAG: CopD family protein [Aquabacterium sp.]